MYEKKNLSFKLSTSQAHGHGHGARMLLQVGEEREREILPCKVGKICHASHCRACFRS